MSGPNLDQPTPLNTKLLAYYHEMVTVHHDDATTGVCPVCGYARCEDWRFARERLVCAGQLTIDLDPTAPSTPDQ